MRRDEHWRIAVDTGGTFTDCLARRIETSPSGRVETEREENSTRRVKILSSGALRGRIVSRLDVKRLKIEASWIDESPSLKGFFFRIPGSGGVETVVAEHREGACEIDVHDVPDGQRLDGAMFEVFTGEPAPVLAARIVTRTPLSEPLPPIAMRLATTRGTNAILERAGEDVALFINEGLGDLLLIGDQQRPDIFALNIIKPPPLYKTAVEVRGRLNADGSVFTPLDLDRVRGEAQRLVRDGVRCAAVALMHSYRNDEHEQAVAAILREEGFEHVACSAELAPLIEILPRAETAVVEAYLAPIMVKYLRDVAQAVASAERREPHAQSGLHVMTSAGGLVRADRYRAKDSLLSGPAGGVAGAAASGRASGFDRIIGFDMGGTSTDVSRYDGDFEYRFEHTVGHARLVAPALAIETVAAGGGSICGFRDGRLFVGPESAGADPGPACYGNGGPLTLTDVNLLMGRIDPALFEVPIDRSQAEAALDALIDTIRDEQDVADRDALLDGFLAIANERMAGAIRQVSLRRGYDPAEYALVSFGGAGGQHACAIASMLGMKTIVMPADASILSAVGLDEAVIERFSQRQVLKTLDEVGGDPARLFDECANQARDEVIAEGIDAERVTVRRRIANVRLLGQDATIAVEVDDVDSLAGEFSQRYEEMYGHKPEGKPIEIESIRAAASSEMQIPKRQNVETSKESESGLHREAAVNFDVSTFRRFDVSSLRRTTHARFDGQWKEVPACRRDAMAVGECIAGPAIILDRRSAYVIETGWEATVDEAGAIVVQSKAVTSSQAAVRDRLVQLELFANRFASIAEEMGQILQRTALSTNVKRRLDFSCAVLDAEGELVVNAPHIPVHLGALGLCVRSVSKAIDPGPASGLGQGMQPGDVIVTNHPAYGGSHLPDITVITPVFDHDHQLLGYVANRAHHAEIGGTRPGSMPPTATTLIEEGVVIPPMHLVQGGYSRWDDLEKLLRSVPHPSRAVADNLADLRAAVAANQRGAKLLLAVANNCGRDEVARQMNAIKDHAAATAEQAIRTIGDGEYTATERLDDGSPIKVAMRIDVPRLSESGVPARRAGLRITIDFTGSAGQHPGNLNATPAIVRSAVLYVLRLLMGEKGKAAGLNEGIMRNVEIILPTGMLNPDFNVPMEQAPAVVGGNVETSQRLVDALLKPLNIVACSQGTMNNVLFGTETFGYYETVCGGCGATADHDGADAVHSHMTNTRITDPELLEHRYPVRLERFAVRRGSGGAGKRRGGDGVVREITFLEPMSLSILSQHRVEQPYGVAGGEAGACGSQCVVRVCGQRTTLDAMDQCEVGAGDRLILSTPGGGGFGEGSER